MEIYYTDKVNNTYLDSETELEYTEVNGKIYLSKNAGDWLCYSLCNSDNVSFINRYEDE